MWAKRNAITLLLYEEMFRAKIDKYVKMFFDCLKDPSIISLFLVLFGDILLFYPAILMFVFILYPGLPPRDKVSDS